MRIILVGALVLSVALTPVAASAATTPRRSEPVPMATASKCSTFIAGHDDEYFWGMSYGFSVRNTGCSTARRTLRRVDDRLFVSQDVRQSA